MIRTDKRHYYVSAIDGPKKYVLAGPYPTHEGALARVQAVADFAYSQSGRAHFMGWGTCGSDEEIKTKLGRF